MSELKKYNAIFCEVFGVNEEQLNESFTNAARSEWDSIGHMNLISAIEEDFGILFKSEDIMEFDSYTKGITLLSKYNIRMGE